MTNRRGHAAQERARGFTLIELAIALFIITLVLGALLVPLTTQIAQRRISDTQKTLDDIKEALLGFAVSNTRLPCPASATSNGVESFCTSATPSACGAELLTPQAHGRCFVQYPSTTNGFVPGITLGLAATDAQGYAIDAWGTRIRYAVTASASANVSIFTSTGGMRTTTLTALAPDLVVCASSSVVTATTCGTAQILTTSAPVVIFSLGLNATTGGGTSADEAANLNGDQVFVSRVRSDPGSAGGEFDDIVTWLSENVLYNRMVAAGQLP
ncbi:MAG: prepilin-type N-terminal cleavage/methylation domain-containing protein [Betaproteobacteria bacterium]|nr:prepilin-type N-terminal cleavage/methylation domain-containing protein [Betaproteobacteria bacterium]